MRASDAEYSIGFTVKKTLHGFRCTVVARCYEPGREGSKQWELDEALTETAARQAALDHIGRIDIYNLNCLVV